MIKTGIIILSGYNFRSIIACCRWASYCDVPFYIIASGKDDPIFHTKYKKQVYSVRQDSTLSVAAVNEWVTLAKDRYDCDLLLFYPSSEYLNLFLLKHRRELETKWFKIPLTDEPTYHQVSFKKQFAQLCKTFNIHVPNQIEDISKKDVFVAKPKAYFSRDFKQLSPLIIRNKNEKNMFLDTFNYDDFFYQEFVDGKSVYLFLCMNAWGNHQVFSQENLIQQPGGKSIILARHSDFHLSSDASKAQKMLIDIGFLGMIMIEFRLSNDMAFMIEANPRPWGPIQFLLDNNIDFFSDHFKSFGLDVTNRFYSKKNHSFYYWSGGFDKNNADYFNYSTQQMSDDYPLIKDCDLLNRNDTHQIFKEDSKPWI